MLGGLVQRYVVVVVFRVWVEVCGVDAPVAGVGMQRLGLQRVVRGQRGVDPGGACVVSFLVCSERGEESVDCFLQGLLRCVSLVGASGPRGGCRAPLETDEVAAVVVVAFAGLCVCEARRPEANLEVWEESVDIWNR